MPSPTLTIPASLAAQRPFGAANSLSGSLSRLASGFRPTGDVNGANTAASQAIATKLAQNVASGRQTNEAIAVTQTVDGSLGTTTDLLQRMRALAVQASDTASSSANRDLLDAEFSRLKAAALSMAGSTGANGEQWLTMGASPSAIAIGAATLDQRQVALVGTADAEDGILTRSRDGLSLTSADFTISGTSSADGRAGVVKALDGMLSDLATARFAVGTAQNGALAALSLSDVSDPGLYSPTSPRVTDHDHGAEFESLRNRMQQGATILSQARNPADIAELLRRG